MPMAFVGAVQAAIRACRRSYKPRKSGNLCQFIFLQDQEARGCFQRSERAASRHWRFGNGNSIKCRGYNKALDPEVQLGHH
jgi:hypothetical protein